jgi:hypothetical protein
MFARHVVARNLVVQLVVTRTMFLPMDSKSRVGLPMQNFFGRTQPLGTDMRPTLRY